MGSWFSPLYTLQLNMRRDGGLVTRSIGKQFDSKFYKILL